jgi:hypothetical protein
LRRYAAPGCAQHEKHSLEALKMVAESGPSVFKFINFTLTCVRICTLCRRHRRRPVTSRISDASHNKSSGCCGRREMTMLAPTSSVNQMGFRMKETFVKLQRDSTSTVPYTQTHIGPHFTLRGFDERLQAILDPLVVKKA